MHKQSIGHAVKRLELIASYRGSVTLSPVSRLRFETYGTDLVLLRMEITLIPRSSGQLRSSETSPVDLIPGNLQRQHLCPSLLGRQHHSDHSLVRCLNGRLTIASLGDSKTRTMGSDIRNTDNSDDSKLPSNPAGVTHCDPSIDAHPRMGRSFRIWNR